MSIADDPLIALARVLDDGRIALRPPHTAAGSRTEVIDDDLNGAAVKASKGFLSGRPGFQPGRLLFEDAPDEVDRAKMPSLLLSNTQSHIDVRANGTLVLWIVEGRNTAAMLSGGLLVHIPVAPIEIVAHAVDPADIPADPTLRDTFLQDAFWNSINPNLHDPFIGRYDPFLAEEPLTFTQGSAEALNAGLEAAVTRAFGHDESLWPIEVSVTDEEVFIEVADHTFYELGFGAASEASYPEIDLESARLIDRAVLENTFEGASMEYNDGAVNRRSGYSESAQHHSVVFERPSAHLRARLRRQRNPANT